MITTEHSLRVYLNKSIDFLTYLNQLQEDVIAYKAGRKVESLHSEYLPINLQRLKRGVKQANLSDKLLDKIQQLKNPIQWLVLTEPWCGDAAQTLGFINAVEKAANGKIKIGLLYRDENLELMDQFLTNGGRAIPKLIQMDEDFSITGTWGPRPKAAQELVIRLKSDTKPYAEALHAWYAKDKNRSLDFELQNLISNKNI